MSLNIKNARVHELAREAARRFGMSQTSVIEEALVRMLASAQAEEDGARQREIRAMEIVDEMRRRLTPEQRRQLLHADDLYDEETGLPA